jgi:hypothetical protein
MNNMFIGEDETKINNPQLPRAYKKVSRAQYCGPSNYSLPS